MLGAVVGGAIGAGARQGLGQVRTTAATITATTRPRRTARSDYDRVRRSGQYNYGYYNRQRCRLAPAPVSSDEYRYVRVCPDGDGRYRITG